MIVRCVVLLFLVASVASATKECQFRDERGVPVMKPYVPSIPLEYWPGEDLCVSCNFFGGLFVVGLEVSFLYLLVRFCTEKLASPPSLEKSPQKGYVVPSWLERPWSIGASLLAVVLGSYYALITLTFLNFICWLFLTGLVLVVPAVLINTNPSDKLFSRRVKLAVIFLGIVTFCVFPNLSILPQQVQRRFDPSNNVILPNDPHTTKLRDMFYAEIPEAKFRDMHFYDQMYAVDEFIKAKIKWQDDFQVYDVAGLLLSPIEVVSRMSGDCQGQAVATSSMLISMGFNAWVVETPFHWWTHAEDPVSGLAAHLNQHGSAASKGSVRPQPIDLIYTKPKDQCHNCPYVDSHNHEPLRYAAPPYRALAIALTGAHMYVRSGVTLGVIPWATLAIGSLVVSLGVALYASLFQADFIASLSTRDGVIRFGKRLAVGFLISVPLCFGIPTWATLYYPFTNIHAFGVLSLALTYVSGNAFNHAIGLGDPVA